MFICESEISKPFVGFVGSLSFVRREDDFDLQPSAVTEKFFWFGADVAVVNLSEQFIRLCISIFGVFRLVRGGMT